MDAVLPLIARDVPRFELSYRSLRRHVAGLDRILVVAPPSHLAAIREALAKFPTGGPQLDVLSELDLVPELAHFERLSGWYKQQIVKLEAANHTHSAFYLTLDADVIATRAVDLDALCAAGTAPCGIEPGDKHPRWYVGAAALIGAPLVRSGITHAVTPTIMHREGARSLIAHLEQRYRDRRYSFGLRGLKQRAGRAYLRLKGARGLAGWRITLCCSRPWSEYSLYFSYLEHTGQYERYHHDTAEPLYTQEQSLWHAQDIAGWDPSQLRADAPPFIVLQSTAVPLERLPALVAPFVSGE